MSGAGNLDHPGCLDQSASSSGTEAAKDAKTKKSSQSHTLLINLKSNKINTKNSFYKVILSCSKMS